MHEFGRRECISRQKMFQVWERVWYRRKCFSENIFLYGTVKIIEKRENNFPKKAENKFYESYISIVLFALQRFFTFFNLSMYIPSPSSHTLIGSLARGQRLHESFEQSQSAPLTIEEQIMTIYTKTNDYPISYNIYLNYI